MESIGMNEGKFINWRCTNGPQAISNSQIDFIHFFENGMNESIVNAAADAATKESIKRQLVNEMKQLALIGDQAAWGQRNS